MSALSRNTASFTCGAADNDEGGEEFHVEHHGGHTGQRVELGRYAAGSDDERILFGQRVDGVVRVTDVPAQGRGRAYLVERGLEHDGYSALKALVADYMEQGELLAAVPMASSPLG